MAVEAPSEVIAGQFLALLTALVQIPVMVWHSRQKNVATLCLVAWFLIFNVHTFISGFIWRGNNIGNWWNGDGLCDIMIRIQVGGHSGVVCATTAIARNLSIILSERGPQIEVNSFRARMIDLMISLTIPVFIMALLIVSLAGRYVLYQYQGCSANLSNQWPTIIVCIIWAPLFAVVAVWYSGVALFRYIKKQRDVKDLLHCTNSGLTRSRFVRLLAFCVIVTGVMFPLNIYMTIEDSYSIDITQKYDWNKDHGADWATVYRHRTDGLYMDQWLYIALGLVQFACLGTGSELVEAYRNILDKCGSVFAFYKKNPQPHGRRTTVSSLDQQPPRKESDSTSLMHHHHHLTQSSPTTLTSNTSCHEIEMHIQLTKDKQQSV